MKGVILAAGKGSRLYPVTHYVPKPILPLANRPTIHYAFDRLKEIGVRDIALVVGENEDAMKAALGSGEGQGVRLRYVMQTEPKGLAHAMSFAKDFVGANDFVMYLGDAIYSESLLPVAEKFRESDSANLNLVQPVENPSRFGIAEVDGDRITHLVEKPPHPTSNLAMAGVYFFRKRIWDTLDDLKPSARGEFEITDAIQMLVEDGDTVLAGVYDGQWFDTGTLPSFLACSRFLLDGGVKVGAGAVLRSPVGASVAIGEGASVESRGIEDSVILPGAVVRCNGVISGCIIGGRVEAGGDMRDQIVYLP